MDSHRGAFEYEWRVRFHLPLSVVGRSMAWGEALRLTEVLLQDPSSWLASSMAGWQYPVARTDLVLMDLYDLQHTSKSKRKPKAYPRPWLVTNRTFGRTSLTPEQLRAILDNLRR